MSARTHALCDDENIGRESGLDVAHDSGSTIIERAFLNGRPQWMDEPVISRWATPGPKILRTLKEVNKLLQQWTVLLILRCSLVANRRVIEGCWLAMA